MPVAESKKIHYSRIFAEPGKPLKGTCVRQYQGQANSRNKRGWIDSEVFLNSENRQCVMVAWSLKGVRSARTDQLTLHRLAFSGMDRLRAAAPFATDEMLYDLIRVPLSVDPLPVRLWLGCEMMADKWRLMGNDRMGCNDPVSVLTQAQIDFVKNFPSWRAARDN